MGYFLDHSTRESALAEAIEGSIAHHIDGDVVYTVQEVTEVEQRYIGVHLLETSGTAWGVKHMDESVGPAAANCPASLLALRAECPVPTFGYAEAWLARCANR
jgi:hypothetical protein